MSEITRADLREISDDLKEYVRERMDHVEVCLGDRLDLVTKHLEQLNGKTDKNATDITNLRTGLGRTDYKADLATGPTWKMLGIGIAAILSIGWGAIEAVIWIKRLLAMAGPK